MTMRSLRGLLYRLVMRIAHRYHWHYAPPCYPDGDTLLWCQWCGFRTLVKPHDAVERRDKHIALQDVTALASARLLIACDAADACEELPMEIDGSLLDAVRNGLIAMYPECKMCAGRGGDEATETLCTQCSGTCVELPEARAQQERK